LVDEPDAIRFLGVDHFTREDQLQSHAFADQSRQTLRAAVSRRDAQLHFGLSKLRVLTGNSDVARHRQLATAAQREAIDRGDDWFAARLDAPQDTLATLRPRFSVEWSLLREIADVGSGDERLWACAGEDRAFDLRFGRDALSGLTQFPHHLIVQGIELVGTVDRDKRDAVADVEQEGLVGHGSKAI